MSFSFIKANLKVVTVYLHKEDSYNFCPSLIGNSYIAGYADLFEVVWIADTYRGGFFLGKEIGYVCVTLQINGVKPHDRY